MPEPTGSDARLQALRRRWETEKSTAFLPLAEEYRRLGRLREAIDVLETGLKGNPTYTSGLVALGRCRLESGDAAGAASVLERVMAQDPEQMVASKLLIDAYLRTGRAREARRRLDIYTTLNAKDPEIARLADRLQATAAPAPAIPEAQSPVAPPAARAPAEELAAEAVEIEAEDAARADERADRPAAAVTARAFAPSLLPAGDRPLFHGLDGPVAVSRYVRGLVAEGLFTLVFPSAAPPPASVAVEPEIDEPAVEPLAMVEAAPLVFVEQTVDEIIAEPVLEEPVVELAPPPAPELVSEPVLEPFEADVERAISGFVPVTLPPAVEVAPSPAGDTATLGDLYLQQGHAADAQRIFGAVLGREPQNDDARRGLGEAQARLAQAGGLSARRASALRDYLRRLTGREERHVP